MPLNRLRRIPSSRGTDVRLSSLATASLPPGCWHRGLGGGWACDAGLSVSLLVRALRARKDDPATDFGKYMQTPKKPHETSRISARTKSSGTRRPAPDRCGSGGLVPGGGKLRPCSPPRHAFLYTRIAARIHARNQAPEAKTSEDLRKPTLSKKRK